MARGLPITLTHLERKLCIVVGGGAVAERKVHSLLEAGARPRVIAPHLTDGLASLAQVGRMEWLAHEYSAGDLSDASLVVAATDDPEINRAVASDAARQHALVNVVDDPEASSFIAPAVLRRGDLTIAICTGGAAPALAGHLRAQFEPEFGPEWERYLELLERLRPQIAARYPRLGDRRQAWARALTGELLELVRRGDEKGIQAAVERIVNGC
jgi:siroheme synthase-like protein